MNPKTLDNIIAKTANKEEYERCVVCGKLTDVPATMPIELRRFYEIGCGQLCAECYKNLKK